MDRDPAIVERDLRNQLISVLGEEMACAWKGVPMPALGEWDHGIDFVTPLGNTVQVKASIPRYPEIMIPEPHSWKLKRVDVVVKAVVDLRSACGKITCWQFTQRFLDEAEVSADGYPIPDTMHMPPGDGSPGTAYRVEQHFLFTPELMASVRARAEEQFANAQQGMWEGRWRVW